MTVNLERRLGPCRGHTHAVYPVTGELKSALLVELLSAANIRSVLRVHTKKHGPTVYRLPAAPESPRGASTQPKPGPADGGPRQLQGREFPVLRGHGHRGSMDRYRSAVPRGGELRCPATPPTTLHRVGGRREPRPKAMPFSSSLRKRRASFGRSERTLWKRCRGSRFRDSTTRGKSRRSSRFHSASGSRRSGVEAPGATIWPLFGAPAGTEHPGKWKGRPGSAGRSNQRHAHGGDVFARSV